MVSQDCLKSKSLHDLDGPDGSKNGLLSRVRGKFVSRTVVNILCALMFTELFTPASAAYIECANGCRTCWSAATDNCMSCETGFYLLDFTCVANGAAVDCGTQYELDENDRICKAIKTEVQFPCEPATYLSFGGAYHIDQCSSGIAGKSYETWGRSAQTATCEAGYYCSGGSSLRTPVTIYEDLTVKTSFNIYSLVTTTPVANYFDGATGNYCQYGTTCPSGAIQETDCDAGSFCPDNLSGAVDTANVCREGFYCSGRANIPTPNNCYDTSGTGPIDQTSCFNIDTSTGDMCSPGNYCPEKSSVESQCNPGTFLPFRMAIESDDCITCPYGYYCPNLGQDDYVLDSSSASLECDPGYYCETGSVNARQYSCPLDSECSGVDQPHPCDSGFYTAGLRQDTCLSCPSGQYCAGQGAALDCEAGTFCVADMLSYCPPGMRGKSGAALGQSTQSDACEICPPLSSCRQAKQ
jgi:hypothetical protein